MKKLLILGILVLLLMYVSSNKNSLIVEHLTSKNPTIYSLSKQVDETNTKIDDLTTQFQKMQEQMQQQAQQAAAAKASLQSIPRGVNNVIPTK